MRQKVIPILVYTPSIVATIYLKKINRKYQKNNINPDGNTHATK